MKFIQITGLALAAMLACTTPAAMAQTSQPIELTGDVKVDKVVVENDKEKHILSNPSVVVPGDKLVFSTTYRNTGKQPASDFVVTNPVPASVMLSPDGADAHITFADSDLVADEHRRRSGSDDRASAMNRTDVIISNTRCGVHSSFLQSTGVSGSNHRNHGGGASGSTLPARIRSGTPFPSERAALRRPARCRST